MKRLVSMLLVLSLGFCFLTACNQTETPNINSDPVTKIVVDADGSIKTITNGEEIDELIAKVNMCNRVKISDQALPAITFRFTTYHDDQAVDTLTVYGEEYLQIDTSLYTCSKQIVATLSALFTVESLDEIADLFSEETKEIEEIAFYNLQENTFKIITQKKDIALILSTLQSLTIENAAATNPVESYKILYRCKGDTEYRKTITIASTDDKKYNQISCGNQSCTILTENFARLYQKLESNPMP